MYKENRGITIKILIGLLITIIVSGLLIGCHPQPKSEDYNTDWRFILISDTRNYSNYAEAIMYDRETKVMYIYYQNGSGGGLCPIYNPDGSLMLYEGK